jgi:hypothetical protein
MWGAYVAGNLDEAGVRFIDVIDAAMTHGVCLADHPQADRVFFDVQARWRRMAVREYLGEVRWNAAITTRQPPGAPAWWRLDGSPEPPLVQVPPKAPFDCTVCPKKFKRAQHLERHLRAHARLRPFPCPRDTCSKLFSRLDNLQGHYRDVHVKPGARRR